MEAFLLYKSVFKTEFEGPVMRFSDGPSCPGKLPLSEADRRLIMQVALPILGEHVLMGTDAPESMGFTVTRGTNLYLNPEPDARAKADHHHASLGEGGKKGATDAGNVLWHLLGGVPGGPLLGCSGYSTASRNSRSYLRPSEFGSGGARSSDRPMGEGRSARGLTAAIA